MVTNELMKGFKQLGDQFNQQKRPQPQGYAQPAPQNYPLQGPRYPQYPHPPQGPARYPQYPTFPVKEDDEMDKWRMRWMKILMYLVGGSAVLLIVWRIIYRFI